MIHVMDGLFIPESEIRFTTARSGGPGGQNVNKVSSKVTLIFDVAASSALSDEQKRNVAMRLASRMNKEGLLQVVSQRTRSQELNRVDVLERFSDLLRRALTPKRPRIQTHVPAVVRQQRVDEKKKRGMTKQERSRKGWDS